MLAFSQWRHKNRYHMQAVVKILAELALPDLLQRITIGGANNTHIDLFQRIVVSPASVTAILWTPAGPCVLAVNSTGRPLTELAPS